MPEERLDKSYLDRRYFIDADVYNCPFCNRRNVSYVLTVYQVFDWNAEKKCYMYFAKCSSCYRQSMHLSFANLKLYQIGDGGPGTTWRFYNEIEDIDAHIFYSVPTSFFTVDNRVPRIIRELISEAEGCLKMNFLTGASGCARKAIYELLVHEKAAGDSYEDRIKFLKEHYTAIDVELFDVLSHIQQMTSDKVHEQSWDKWDSQTLKLIIETLKTVLYEIYVLPDEKNQRKNAIHRLREQALGKSSERTTEVDQ